jgi:SpoVK/Ycf46/Vps4 family AAA+-type ATPase
MGNGAKRSQVFLLATTNRPEHVDPALRRPGGFDQVVWMGLPDERGRADIFEHYLRGLKLAPTLSPGRLAAKAMLERCLRDDPQTAKCQIAKKPPSSSNAAHPIADAHGVVV